MILATVVYLAQKITLYFSRFYNSSEAVFSDCFIKMLDFKRQNLYTYYWA